MKKATQTSEQVETVESAQPEYVTELLLNGTAVFEAPTREELAEMVDNIPADCKYSAGFVGQSFERGTFTLELKLLNNS